MNVLLNGKVHEMKPGQTVWDALERLGVTEPKGVAVAVGNEVVPQNEWRTTFLADGQRLEILRAVQGGSH